MTRRLISVPLLLALAAAGCMVPTSKKPVPTSEGVVASRAATTVTLTGLVTAPAGVVAAGGANVVAAGGGNVVAAGGGNVVAAGGGNVVAPGGGNYRTLEAPTEAPLANVEVYVADAAGTPIANMPRVRTDAQGRYRLPRVPKGFTFKVVAAAQTPEGKAVALQSIAKTDAVTTACDVGGITTLVAETVSEGSNGLLGQFDPATFASAVADTRATIAADEVPTDWSDRAALRATMRKLAKRLAKLEKAVDTLQGELAEAEAKAADLEAALATIAKQSPAPTSPVPSAIASATATATPGPAASAIASPSTPPTATTGTLTVVVDGTLLTPKDVAFDGNGHMVVADKGNDMVRLVGVSDGLVSAMAIADASVLNGPFGVAVDAQKNVYVSVHGAKNQIVMITPAGQNSNYAGSDTGYADGPGATAMFSDPSAIVFDGAGNLYVADSGNHCIRKIAPDHSVTTLAGTTKAGSADGKGSLAGFNGPRGLAVSSQGVVFVADTSNHLIRRISADGTVTTLAGSGSSGLSDGVGAKAAFNSPNGIMLAADGSLIVADSGNGKLRRVDPATGAVTTLALSRSLSKPVGLAQDGAGRIWVADSGTNQLLRLDP